jgi:hypothetical protein
MLEKLSYDVNLIIKDLKLMAQLNKTVTQFRGSKKRHQEYSYD